MPSDKKPSTDQVLTNTLRGFGLLARWVSRSAICTPLTPRRCARRAHSSLVFGSAVLSPRSLARLTSPCLTNQDTMPGLAPQHETAVVPPGFFRRSASTVSRQAELLRASLP